ncbi:protein of unknown function [Maridesulfovibrio hydrothermalis AM13 = DSM 14728]|uniref:Uncharacterized protein n=1 Tax=Maridesulfovibrio hydrothermalis AM13 = DSM 14728 TaxID=1121451 RepID=L0R7U4_9BACT|nr:protein of unknown function [Maridesulfovibrio hydrothermalis AM13 = DSM 14728]
MWRNVNQIQILILLMRLKTRHPELFGYMNMPERNIIAKAINNVKLEFYLQSINFIGANTEKPAYPCGHAGFLRKFPYAGGGQVQRSYT